MSYICSWCLLSGLSEEESTKPGDPPAHCEDGKPICPDCADERSDIDDVTEGI